ncbi:uridylate kinase PUMPKIN, chloroplastic [Argentina anserina]|uniref:uridylate kinase PUMPKIN, chloroplastic n=1 Tax=Argentina anserina TaxID=57926 RepID=UPI002176910B|nr:uridylate kinase PUMPKIN, chloroplastic [Potentilla anserina]
MASCDDDFSILGSNDSNPNHRNPHAPPATHRIPPPYAARFATRSNPQLVVTVSSGDKTNAAEDPDDGEEDYADAAAFNPFDSGTDQNDVASKRKDQSDELSDGAGGGGGGGGGSSYTVIRRSKSSAVSAGDYRKDREEWSDGAIACLLDAYMDKFTQLNRGNLRGRDWEEVAVVVSQRSERQSKSVEQCKNKVDNLKKRYKLERHRMTNSGNSPSHWPWFKRMEQIVGNSLPAKATSDDDRAVTSSGGTMKSKRNASAITSPAPLMNKQLKVSLKWRRVVFKISGAALAGTAANNIDPKLTMLIAREVAIACRSGVEVAIVIGGRNFFCGNTWVNETGLDRSVAYQTGMMTTVMNSILLQSAFEKMGIQTRVQSAFSLPELAEPYNRQRAIRHLEKGRVVIFAGIGAGTGNPLFTTDTAAALRASEIHAEAVLKGTNVDGVYDRTSQDNNFTFQHISFRDLVVRGEHNMDTMALTLCEDNRIPVVIFNLLETGNISKALRGEQVGTLIDQVESLS